MLDAFSEEQPPELLKHGGYELRGLYDGRSVDLARLMAGSDGTLALTSEIELATGADSRFGGCFWPPLRLSAPRVDAVAETIEYQPTRL